MQAKRKVYADNAATTAVSEQVLEAMLPFYKEVYGNPSSLYELGQQAKAPLEQARADVAACLGAKPNEIYFTSCGSESDNWAIKGAARAQRRKHGKTHIITSAFEHHAVLHTCQALEKDGFTVTYLPVHDDGLVRPEELSAAITDDTALVTIMYANNEIGTIQPIEELGRICKERGVLFHTDAVQAVGNVHIDVKAQNIDMLSLSGHKIHAPKGVGALYIRSGVLIENFMDGGAQERGRRAGTENVAQIVGLATAIKRATDTIDQRIARLTPMRDKLIDGILKIDRSRLNGSREHRLPGNASFCFQGVEGESLLLLLDMHGISGSSGSACTSGSLDPSHVLLSIGLPHEVAHGSLRLTLDRENTMEDVEAIVKAVTEVVNYLREMSPVWKALQRGERQYVIQ